jgi:hypothetical protein
MNAGASISRAALTIRTSFGAFWSFPIGHDIIESQIHSVTEEFLDPTRASKRMESMEIRGP